MAGWTTAGVDEAVTAWAAWAWAAAAALAAATAAIAAEVTPEVEEGAATGVLTGAGAGAAAEAGDGFVKEENVVINTGQHQEDWSPPIESDQVAPVAYKGWQKQP